MLSELIFDYRVVPVGPELFVAATTASEATAALMTSVEVAIVPTAAASPVVPAAAAEVAAGATGTCAQTYPA